MLIISQKNANKAEKLLKLIAENKINDWDEIKEVVKDKKLFLHIESRFRLRNYFNFENDSRTKKPSEIEDIKKYDKEIVCDVLEDAIKEFQKEQGNHISTLDCFDLNNIRQSGNSTRQVDFAIQ
jgi:superfamily II helicase